MEKVKHLPVALLGTGSAVPSRVMANEDFAAYLDTSAEWIVTRTGIRERRIASDGESTGMLGTAAGKAALEEAGVDPGEVDMIVCATVTPDVPLPATACYMQRDLRLKNASAFDMAAACSGFVYAVVTAGQFLCSETCNMILVVGADCMSRLTNYEDRASCILFGDGAGAAVLGRAKPDSGVGILHSRLYSDGDGADLLYVPAGGSRMPATEQTIRDRQHYMKMQGREIYKFAVTRMQEIIEQTLDEAGVSPDDVDLVIPHQSNLRMIESARKKMGWPAEKMLVNIDRYGNTSSASVAIGLDEARKDGRIGPGSLVLVVAFGAGLTWASVLWRL